ncbi:hypothetical protein [Methylocaldum marinum]|uniref:hypothetical protein n=1 Tax=Methylocaldum marinum TaxID=1432792 RepID=UPI00147314BE|nr:hypothetical protein [Methylocaldum marinum]
MAKSTPGRQVCDLDYSTAPLGNQLQAFPAPLTLELHALHTPLGQKTCGLPPGSLDSPHKLLFRAEIFEVAYTCVTGNIQKLCSNHQTLLRSVSSKTNAIPRLNFHEPHLPIF